MAVQINQNNDFWYGNSPANQLLVKDLSIGNIVYQDSSPYFMPIWPNLYEGSNFEKLGNPPLSLHASPLMSKHVYASIWGDISCRDSDSTPEKIQISFWWLETNYQLEIPFSNVDKIEVVSQEKVTFGPHFNIISEVLIYLLRPGSFHKFVAASDPTSKKGPSFRTVSPLDMTLTSDYNPVCQVLNYWNVCQVVKLRGEFDRRGAISNFELFLKKLTDVGAIREYSFAKPEN